MAKETQQEKIFAMQEDGFTPREMQETLGCSIGSIYSTLSKFSLKPNQKSIQWWACTDMGLDNDKYCVVRKDDLINLGIKI